MATNITGVRGSHGTTQAERGTHLKSEISTNVTKDKAREILTTLNGKIANRWGYLRLDGSGKDGEVGFTTRWNTNPFRNAKGEVTGAALKALFEKAGYDTGKLDEYLKGRGNSRITLNSVRNLLSQAIHDTVLKESLRQYRRINVGGVEVGGAARPTGNSLLGSATQTAVLENIGNAGYQTILSIDDSPETRNMAPEITDLGLNHILDPNLTVEDFQTPTYRQMEAIQERIQEEADEGRKVLIHCGAGGGRTGTVLASLVLRDLVQAERRNNRQFWQDGDQSLPVALNYDIQGNRHDYSYFGVTPLVKQAIETIRKKDSSEMSVETPQQVEELMKYQFFLTRDQAPPNMRQTLIALGMYN